MAPKRRQKGAVENGRGSPRSTEVSPTGEVPDANARQQQQQQQQLRLIQALQQQQQNSLATQRKLQRSLLLSFLLFATSMGLVVFAYREIGLTVAFATAVCAWQCGAGQFLLDLFSLLIRRSEGSSYADALRRADIMMQPILQKETVTDSNESLSFACSCMQGWRRSMEDAHTLELLDEGGFFGVYDGHSGAATARFCGDNLFKFVSGTKEYAQGNISKALYNGFIACDRHLFNMPNHERSGCTAVVLYVRDDELYCANAGDSRCVLCRDGEAFPLSIDHKPFSPTEQTRIERAGSYVLNRRVNGILALSRAIGDFGFKSNSQLSWDQQAVTSAPEVRTTRLNRDKDEFAVVACDGIWDMMSSDQVVQFVRSRLSRHMPLDKIAEALMDACLSPHPFGLGCDNMSVIIIRFHRGAHGNHATGASSLTSPPVPASDERSASTPPNQSGSFSPREEALVESSVGPSSPGRNAEDTSARANTEDNASGISESSLGGRDGSPGGTGKQSPSATGQISATPELDELRSAVSTHHAK